MVKQTILVLALFALVAIVLSGCAYRPHTKPPPKPAVQVKVLQSIR